MNYKRVKGPHNGPTGKRYTEAFKRQVIKAAIKLNSCKIASALYKVPIASIHRWWYAGY